ncbi:MULTISPECIES: lipocalin-like domain-containing protein [unclassified Pseudomonas]|uniref:lipocalin-like domain-containing protein n=1 Tax=unclassified Pseudomonas TaxID=196821 RepID=UPI002B23EDA3|nr:MULTISPECIES: lipocalin-like domain-containing protein [unclassified Pseudomonas]MEA9978528.1 lipocalin-like domain-containing protein [Pseudomonas sp. RTS4]MEB0199103.1 lipocalin-like domain-containing protein [Pseudomonas sp. 5S4]MEB0248217.1 lipocalin-like domain-containing protein [Pseudomonas sp. 10S5]
MRINWLLLALSVLLLGACDDDDKTPANGFAGLGNDAAAFAQVVPGKVFSFPEDHGPHDGFRIEWWYVTANLKDDQGQDFGVQWTLFRSALKAGPEQPGWADQTIWMGHAAVTSANQHYAAERYARGGVGQAGVSGAPFKAWIDDWTFDSQSTRDNPLTDMQLHARGPSFNYQLHLTSSQPLVLQGAQGFSQKSEQGQASYYYSQPFLQASGSLDIDGKTYHVSGPAWLDREWSSQPLTANQTGWDWFSVHLESGAQLMLYRMRQKSGEAYLTGTWIDTDGKTQLLNGSQIQLTPLSTSDVADHKIPTRWSVKIPSKQLDIVTTALNPNAWMDLRIPYWEGPVTVSGNQAGIGYLEMTGY